MSSSALCKLCFYYNHADKTCVRSVVAVSNGKVHNDYAKSVRIDTKRCGPQGKWFVATPANDGLSPVEELFESFDM
jgi:hypothetical protein